MEYEMKVGNPKGAGSRLLKPIANQKELFRLLRHYLGIGWEVMSIRRAD